MRLWVWQAPVMLATACLAGTAAAGGGHTFTLGSGARTFAATIGSKCIAAEGESIEADERTVTVNASPLCTAEIEEIARNWAAADPAETIVTVTGSPEGLSLQRQALEARFGRAPNSRLRFLGSTQTCRCLVIAGKRSLEAGSLARSDAPRTEPQPPAPSTPPDSLMLPPNDRNPRTDQGLFDKAPPAGAGGGLAPPVD